MILSNKIAIITGAAQGMGYATSKLFIESGARVAMVDIQGDKLAQAVQSVEMICETPLPFVLDISDPNAVAAGIQKVLATWGRIDILVNNAAIQGPGGTFVDATEEIWDRYLAVNVKGAGYFVREVIPVMKEQGGGSIVNIGSISGMVVFPGQAVYATTKGAIQQLTRAIAVDFGMYNIRANCILPGPTLSGPLAMKQLEKPELDLEKRAREDSLAKQHPLGRIALPEDIAQAALFLASDASRHITGVFLPVDGGFTIR